MDFFEHQEVARKRTGRLVVLFALAVLGIIALVYLAVAFAMGLGSSSPEASAIYLDVTLLLVVSAIVSLVVGLSSVGKIASLRSGGAAVASTLKGRLVTEPTRNEHERRLLNVVEEMAIASSVPVPAVYVLDHEEGINAFAAGWTTNNAVIGVTRGTMEKLTRDELQSVIAHEFSHILNGDMRLNIRLMGIVFGILILGIIGRVVVRALSHGSRRSSRGKESTGVLVVLVVGFALMVIGYIGTFFGQWIKASISRQREFLADASAVQFTRNPSGISGALKKIGGYAAGSSITNPQAEEISHMLFGQGFNAIFATHPPLKDRIRRIEPTFDGTIPTLTDEKPVWDDGKKPALRVGAGVAELGALAMIGQPTRAHLEHAQQLVATFPRALKSASTESYGARAVVYALLLSREEGTRRDQLRVLQNEADSQVYAATQKLLGHVGQLDPNARLPLIDLSIPALRELSEDQFLVFRHNVESLIRADCHLDVFEWTLSRVVLHHVEPIFEPKKKNRTDYYSLKTLSQPCELLLSTLAYVGHTKRDDAERAFGKGSEHLNIGSLSIRPLEECSLQGLGEVHATLSRVSFPAKRDLLYACAATISADKRVTVEEGELLRGIADSLDCPMPPLLPGQSLV